MSEDNPDKIFEPNSRQGESPAPENREELSPEKTIGPFLKDEREKRGLSYSQIFEITKLRQPILEALENEAWDSLASPVFASGFVRIYGNSLGLEEELVMSLFQKSKPETVFEAKPLVPPAKGNKTFFLTLMFLILGLFSAYFFWQGYALHKKVPVNHGSMTSPKTGPGRPEKIQKAHNEIEAPTSTGQNQLDSVFEPPPESDKIKQIESSIKEDEAAANDSHGTAVLNDTPALELTLKASIKKTTWLRIFVDDRTPKEYIFHPEEHFTWKARKGFELLIGNAGGVDLEYNGNAVEVHGTPGQVVRLRLPEGYKRRPQGN